MEAVKSVDWNKIKSIFNNAQITKPSKQQPATYELVSSFDNPFGAIHSEEYTTKDLIKISQNVEREKVYQLKPAKSK